MSYFFSMAFTAVPDKTAAYDLCQKAVNLLTEKDTAQDHIKNMYPYFVSRCKYELVTLSNFIRDMWVQDVFQVRFVYWPQYNLLSLCGDNYPKAVTDLFGGSIDFQNSTDQDYDLSIWDTRIPIFESLVSNISAAKAEALRDILGFDMDEDVDEDYMRRSAIYKSVFQALELGDWIYGRDGCFERIKMSGLTSQEKTHEVQRWVQAYASKLLVKE